MKDKSRPRFFWRLIALAVVILTLSTAAVWFRDSAATGLSTQWFGQRVNGTAWPWSLVDAVVNLVALGAVVYVVVWVVAPRLRYRYLRWKRQRARKIPITNSNATLVSDSPLTSPDDDELERFQFARDVIYTITVAPPDSSFVVAIEGPWGEGKTTILGWVGQELARHPLTPIVVTFDPWPEDTKRGVVARLFDAVAIALNARPDLPPTARIEASRLFGRLADAASSERPTTYGLIRAALGWLAYPDKSNYRPHRFSGLESDREQLQQCIGKLDHRLVIIVDDLDRVDGEELRGIFMAVNALSSFDNTAIVLAFDPNVVDKTLRIQGFSGSSTGSNFREKIVQVSLPLPRPSFADRQRLFEKSFDRVLNRLDAKQHWDSWAPQLLQQAVYKAVELAPSPRSLKRLANHTALLVARLQGEVNSGDVLLLELLRAHYAAAWYFTCRELGTVRTHGVEPRYRQGSQVFMRGGGGVFGEKCAKPHFQIYRVLAQCCLHS